MKIRSSDIIWNYVGTILSLGSNFIILPFIIFFLDSESLGLWYVFLSLGAIVVLFDFGFNPTLARNIAYCWSGANQLSKIDVIHTDKKQPNIPLLKEVIVTSRFIYFYISLLAIIILLTFGTIYIFFVSSNLEGFAHIIAWIIYSCGVFLNLYYGYFATFLRGVGAIKEYNIATINGRLLQIISSIVLLNFGFGINAVAFSYLMYGLVFRVCSKRFFYKFQNIGELIGNDKTVVDKLKVKNTFILIWHNAWRDGLVSLSSYLSNQASVLIASFYFSLTVTGMYSITVQLITAIAAIAGSLYTSFQPSLQSSYLRGDKDQSLRLMSTAMTTYTITFWLGVLSLIVIGLPLISIVKEDALFNIPILIAISIYQFLLKYHSYFASYISNTNRVPYMRSFIIYSVLGIIMSLFLINTTKLGIWGLIISQMLAQAIYNNWKWPSIVMQSLDTNFLEITFFGFKNIVESLKSKILKSKSYIN
jgi:O-antigen/teichoic acid export membrane protein